MMKISAFAPHRPGTPSKVAAFAAMVAILAAMFALRCGGGDPVEPRPRQTPAASVTTTPTEELSPTPTPEPPTEFRVAFINLFSPLTLDVTDEVAGATFNERLDLVIAELKEFKPDLIGFNEASRTEAHGSAITKLAKELKMEFVFARANPWYPGTSKEQSDELQKQLGFEEGELILSRYPIVGQPERVSLNPRTSESGEGRAMLHVVVKVPGTMGKLDVFITHLTGGGDRVQRLQAADFATKIAFKRGDGYVVAMVGQSDPEAPSLTEIFSPLALTDIGAATETGTCCRESVIGEQPPLEARTDTIFVSERWKPVEVRVIGAKPGKRADGTLLYGSDHNGIAAVFPIEPMWRDGP